MGGRQGIWSQSSGLPHPSSGCSSLELCGTSTCAVATCKASNPALASCGALTCLNPSHASQRCQDSPFSHLWPTEMPKPRLSPVQGAVGPVEDNAGAAFSCLGFQSFLGILAGLQQMPGNYCCYRKASTKTTLVPCSSATWGGEPKCQTSQAWHFGNSFFENRHSS